MTLMYGTLEALANLFSRAGLWITLWVIALVGFSVFIHRMFRAVKTDKPWGVRKGVCPFCNNELFGTTREYQRLNLLETLSPESKYLCTSCDTEKVSGLLSKLG
ncbi:hypothetical protein [Candidatus Entotheonella palauensis]|uniref:hypothetical protein n=1 Tax=Candidatus Entotheonella palauensis TaxID=93172 RepID=UPI000B7CA308|nr:hypothetical protein [Candidatus Entotheonella palauensis]